MKKLSTALFTLSTLALIGCGGGGGSSSSGGTNPDGTAKDPYKIQKVEYTLNGSDLPSCNKPARVTTIKARNDNDRGSHSCFWTCGDYEGANPIAVLLSFTQDGKNGVWEYDGDVLVTAPQQCHN